MVNQNFKHRFFIDQALSVSQCVEADKKLTHYILHVLRLDHKCQVILFNNSASEFIAQVVVDRKRKQVVLRVEDEVRPKHRESFLPLYLGLSVIRSERFDWAIQKVTELGVHGIYPLIAQRTQVRFESQRLANRMAHWRGVSVAACEQSGRTKVPTIFNALSLAELLEAQQHQSLMALCLPQQGHQSSSADNRMRSLSRRQYGADEKMICLIGPEGGWSDVEMGLFERDKVVLFSLGQRVLRSETAAVVATALIQSGIGDLT